MAIIVDVVILAIILTCIIIGYKKGLIGVAVKILGFFIALIIALILYKPVSNFIINNTPVADTLQEGIRETVTAYVIGTEEEKGQEESESPKVLTDYITDFIETEKKKAQQTEKEIIDNVSRTVVINLIKIASAILVFIISKIGLSFVKALARIISKLPIIGQFNKLGGAIYGILQGILIVYIVLAIISVFAPTMKNSGIIETINSSKIGKIMYNENIILKIIF